MTTPTFHIRTPMEIPQWAIQERQLIDTLNDAARAFVARYVRPDGTLKPHAEVIRQFAATHPTVIPATRPVTLDCSVQEFYQDPSAHMKRLFATFAGSDRFKS